MPVGVEDHCVVKINATAFAILGGFSDLIDDEIVRSLATQNKSSFDNNSSEGFLMRYSLIIVVLCVYLIIPCNALKVFLKQNAVMLSDTTSIAGDLRKYSSHISLL